VGEDTGTGVGIDAGSNAGSGKELNDKEIALLHQGIIPLKENEKDPELKNSGSNEYFLTATMIP